MNGIEYGEIYDRSGQLDPESRFVPSAFGAEPKMSPMSDQEEVADMLNDWDIEREFVEDLRGEW